MAHPPGENPGSATERGRAWLRGACVAKVGMHVEGGMHGQVVCVCGKVGIRGKGACMARGGGHVWQGVEACVVGGACVAGGGICVGETATKTGSTHPSRMHSYFQEVFRTILLNKRLSPLGLAHPLPSR